MDLSMSSREDPFAPESIFSQQDLPVVPNDNPESYCRLCLTTPDVVPLFPTGSDPNVYVLELIGQYIGIGLTIQDDVPCAVCQSCQMILDQFDLFRQNCLKVDIAIRRRRLGLDRVVKTEPQDDDDEEEVELPYIRLENRVYQCRICSEVFRSMALFMAHCKEEHPDEAKMYKCKHCSKSFMSKTARLQHIRSHRPSNSDSDFGGLRVQVCEKCMVTFDSYKLLKIHIKENHSNDPKQDALTCITCARQFSRITILRNHILRVHMGKLPYVCKQCGISFGYAQQLVSHLKNEHGISPDQFGMFADDEVEQDEGLSLVPPVAQLELASAPAPLEELKPPAVEEPAPGDVSRKPINKYTCMECQVQCYSQGELRDHRKTHQDPTWWKCTHCRNFVKHRQMHLLKKHPTISESDLESSFTVRYRCWMCRMYFKSLHQMEVHANVKHQVPLPEHHQQEAIPDELEEGEIRPDASMEAPASTVPPPAPPSMMPPMALPGLPQPMTVQPPLSIVPEHFPLLLSQLENGAMDYLREFSRLIDPNNHLAATAQLNIKQEPMDTSQSAMDLSGGSAVNLTSSAVDLHTTRDNTGTDQQDDNEGEGESEDDTFFRLDNRTYQCKFCPEIFHHLLRIRKHTKKEHPSEWKSFKCYHCKRRFPCASMRDRHSYFHRLNLPFKCTECDQVYISKKRLDKHFEMYHDRNSHHFSMERFKCGSCELTFGEKKYYELHSRIYHERKMPRFKNLSDKIQVCERCNTMFDSRELLMEHIRQTHQGDPPLKNYICQTCSKDLKTVTLLRIHILVVHMGIMPFVCQHCNAEFATRHWLLKHLEKEHSEVDSFKCPSCSALFSTESEMTEHKDLVHTQPETKFDPQSGTAVYPCSKCEKKFESKDLLDKHQAKAHPSFMLMYKCPLCVQPVRYRKQHMRVHHDVEYDSKEHPYQLRYKCHCCSKIFQQKRNLISHQNSVANQCGRCQMKFKTKKNLQTHMAAHRSNKSLKCEDCGLDFGYRGRLEAHRLRYHSATSTQVLKIINCPYCPKLFISPSNRERHIAANHVQSEFKVNCGHCPVQVTDTAQLRKHYKTVHPEERVTFKCPGCEKFYVNLSSFKDHYKKHKQDERDGKEETDKGMNSTNEADGDVEMKASVVGEGQAQAKGADGALESMLIKEEAQINAGKVANPTESAAMQVKVSQMSVGEPLEEEKIVIKQESINGEASTSKNPVEWEKSVVKEEPVEQKPSDPELFVEHKIEVVGTEAAVKESAVEPVVAEQLGPAVEQKVIADKESTAEGKPDVEEPKQEEKAIVEETTEETVDKSVAKAQPEQNVASKDAEEKMAVDEPKTIEEPEQAKKTVVEETTEQTVDRSVAEERSDQKVALEDAEEKMVVDEPKSQEKMELVETAEETINKSTEGMKPEQEIALQHVSVVEEKSAFEDPNPDEKMEAKETGLKSTSVVKPEQEIAPEHVTVVEEAQQKEKTTVEETTEATANRSAAEVKSVQETTPENVSTAVDEATPEEKTTVEETTEATADKCAVEVKSEQGTTPENVSTAVEEVTPEEKATVEKTNEATANKSAVEVNSGHETTPENVSKAAEEATPDQKTTVEETTEANANKSAVEVNSEQETTPENVSTAVEEATPEEKTTVEDTTTEEPANKSETAELKAEQEIALENVVLDEENPILSDAPQLETSSSKGENDSVGPTITKKVDQEDKEDEERTLRQDDEANEQEESEAIEEPLVEKQLEQSLPECSKKDEKPEDSSLPEHSEPKLELMDCVDNAVDEIPPEDAAKELAESHPPEEEREQKLESPAEVKETQEPTASMENSKDDPPPDELRSATESPASTMVESPYTVVETSNEASEVSESSAVSERSTKAKITRERQRISTRNILKRKKKLVVLLEPVDIDKLMELSRGSSSSPSLERVAMKGSGSSSESQPAEDGVQKPAKRLRRERGTPTSDTVAGDS